MMRKTIWIAIMGAGIGMAETPAKAPEITDAHKLAYFKRLLILKNAQQAAQQAEQAFQAAVADITKDCGDQFVPQMSQDGDPICIVKPPVKK